MVAPVTRTAAAALAAAHARLAALDSARLDAELLLAHVLGCPRTRFYSDPGQPLDAAALARFEALVTARAGGQPLAYLTGRAEFWSLTLAVGPDVLVPRADTELVVDTALELGGADAVVADLGTGSGAIACAYASERRAGTGGRERPRCRRAGPARATTPPRSGWAAYAACVPTGWRRSPRRAWTCCSPTRRTSARPNPPRYRPSWRMRPRHALFAGRDGLDALRRIAADATTRAASRRRDRARARRWPGRGGARLAHARRSRRGRHATRPRRAGARHPRAQMTAARARGTLERFPHLRGAPGA